MLMNIKLNGDKLISITMFKNFLNKFYSMKKYRRLNCNINGDDKYKKSKDEKIIADNINIARKIMEDLDIEINA